MSLRLSMVLALLAVITMATTAWAQYPGGASGTGGPGGAGGTRGGMGGGMGGGRGGPPPDAMRGGPPVDAPLSPGAIVQVQLDQLEDDLKLAPAQIGAWRAYTDKVQKLADDTTRTAVLVDPAWDVDGLVARVARAGYTLVGALATLRLPAA